MTVVSIKKWRPKVYEIKILLTREKMTGGNCWPSYTSIIAVVVKIGGLYGCFSDRLFAYLAHIKSVKTEIANISGAPRGVLLTIV
jgi:hypothetical protein